MDRAAERNDSRRLFLFRSPAFSPRCPGTVGFSFPSSATRKCCPSGLSTFPLPVAKDVWPKTLQMQTQENMAHGKGRQQRQSSQQWSVSFHQNQPQRWQSAPDASLPWNKDRFSKTSCRRSLFNMTPMMTLIILPLLFIITSKSPPVGDLRHWFSGSMRPGDGVFFASPLSSSTLLRRHDEHAILQQSRSDLLSSSSSSSFSKGPATIFFYAAASPSDAALAPQAQAPPRRLQAGIYYNEQDRARKGQFYLWLSVALVAVLVLAIVYTLKIADVFDPLLHTRFTPSDRTR